LGALELPILRIRNVERNAIDQVLEAQPTAVAEFQSGQTKALGFLIGQVMQASGGKANPKLLRELLDRKLAPSG
jgi:aspartyl-tRNA(Asn)/glutamyl-tRNA(Gln) amidotransferase subunit B